MRLHVETIGQGEPLILLHGWGMHSGIWQNFSQQLAQAFELHLVDLPGHGQSDAVSPYTLERLLHCLQERFTYPAHVLGWSLGGILAQFWAIHYPQQIKKLILLASTPCFAVQHDWVQGMPQVTLQQFAQALEQDYAATLRRFLALQVRGGEGERELLMQLRAALFQFGEPDLSALAGGLEILRATDLRSQIHKVLHPTLLIAGGRDKLTPPQASHYLLEVLPQATLLEVGAAAHAPFLSHTERVVTRIKEFLHG